MNGQADSVDALFAEALRLHAALDLGGAERALRELLRIDPSRLEAHANLGLVLEASRRIDEAESCYRAALAIDTGFAPAHNLLGTALMAQGRYDEAGRALRRAVELEPRSPAFWTNYGVLLARRKQESAAENCYRSAIALDPGYANASFNLAYLLLRAGKFEEGWQRFEYRDWYDQIGKAFGVPRWQGEDIAGKSIAIGIEAGHGDMIQFCRYAALLKARGAAHVSLLCHPALLRLFGRLAGVDEALDAREAFSDRGWDFWVPAMSLPHWFNTRLDSIPADLPYLSAAPEVVSGYAGLFDGLGSRLRVGLVWKGNPSFENDQARSLPSLAALSPLATCRDVAFFSLQKGPAEEEIATPPFRVENLAPYLNDFADTAAMLMHLDLVICVDTAVAHLAGALGRNCWVLLPDHLTDWRWMTERTDSPWYPGAMRLFRQGVPSCWAPVIETVAAALERYPRPGRFSSP